MLPSSARRPGVGLSIVLALLATVLGLVSIADLLMRTPEAPRWAARSAAATSESLTSAHATSPATISATGSAGAASVPARVSVDELTLALTEASAPAHIGDTPGAAEAMASPVLAERGAGPGGSSAASAPTESRAAAPADAPIEAAASGPLARVHLTTTTDYYAVEGSDLWGLLAALRRQGPIDGGGTWAASTAWVFRWSYRTAADARMAPDSGCRVASAQVILDLAYTYPRWSPPQTVPAETVAAWDAYLEHVEAHEHGHREIAESAAADLIANLEALPAARSCSDLAVSARQTAASVLDRHAESQSAYDRETGHGETQGAVLAVQ